MRHTDLNEITGKTVKEWYEWLRKEDMGCCSVWFASTEKYRFCVCMGWHDYGDGFRVAWKIGRRTHDNIMQCDFDVDFEMPCNPETGDVDDTLEEVECEKIVHPKSWRWSSPKGYRGWNALAACMRKTARRVYRDWKDNDE